jgi:hypothetical protein
MISRRASARDGWSLLRTSEAAHGIPSPKATLRREPGAFDLNDACKSAAKIRGSQSDGDYHRY